MRNESRYAQQRLVHGIGAALVAACSTILSLPAAADGWCSPMRTVNSTPNKMWVTIYDTFKLRHLDYGWVDGCSVREWRSGNYSCGVIYFVRAEVKNADASANIFDTTVQVNANLKPDDLINPSTAVTLRKNAGGFLWDHGMTVTCDTSGHCGCDQTPPANVPTVDFTFKNDSTHGMYMEITASGSATLLKNECVESARLVTWKVPAAPSYTVKPTWQIGTGCPQGPIATVQAYTATPVSGKVDMSIYDTLGVRGAK